MRGSSRRLQGSRRRRSGASAATRPSNRSPRSSAMEASFDSAQFVADVGHDLVTAFTRARKGTTPGLVGDATERPVRDRLEQILPRGIAVGSGCIIDTNGNTSRQIDVVLYERYICPVFSINNSPETTYYPCEGVIAVGEIKAGLGSKELGDAFTKIASVKRLSETWHNTTCHRSRASRHSEGERDHTVRLQALPLQSYTMMTIRMAPMILCSGLCSPGGCSPGRKLCFSTTQTM